MTRPFHFQTFGRRPSTLGGWLVVLLGALVVGGLIVTAVVLGAALLMVGLAVSAVGALGWWLRQQLGGASKPGSIGYADSPHQPVEVKTISVDEITVERAER